MIDDRFIADAEKSLLRFIMFDDPVENPDTHGMLKYIIMTESIYSALAGFPLWKFNKDDITVELEVDKIVLYENISDDKCKKKYRWKHRGRKKGRCDEHSVTISGGDKKVYLNNNRTYTPIIRGVSLPEGTYRQCRVYFKKSGKLYADDEVYPLKLGNNSIHYYKQFSIQKGKITSLYSISLLDKLKNIYLKIFKHKKIFCKRHQWHWFKKCHEHVNVTLLGFLSFGQVIHEPVDELYVTINRLYAVKESGERLLLNDTVSGYELLSLRNGACALIGNNAIDAGVYNQLECELGTNNKIYIGDKSYSLSIEDWSYTSLYFEGPFELRGGRVTELFFHFDPNLSLFYVPETGYIMEPNISVTSAVSMTPDQEHRLVESIGALSNTVLSNTELAFQGQVQSTASLLDTNIHGKNMIYTNVTMSVQDRLRGTLDGTGSYILKTIGGSYNDLTLHVKGMPEFQNGENVLLFLKDYNGRMSTVHGEYGKITLE